ncbi:MAG: aminopeptidase P family protein [Gordonia sp. (in: high G+C Gram-positive bacteria)]|uniref:M24 family metallopeptidase n=1 Tax=Gordonia sp. (in: high G+C Gram-positive bacteria) TaxID=84139 RepID=UPI0039E72877
MSVIYDHPARRARLATLLAADGVDALLVTDLVNVRYLSGFTGSNGALLIAAGAADPADTPEAVIATDGRYTSQVADQAPDLPVVLARDTGPALVAGAGHLRRVGIEADAVTVAGLEALRAAAADVELVPLRGVVERLREVKDAGEFDQVEQACAIGDQALAALVDGGRIVPGRTERQVARDLEWAMFERGAEAVAFETIVAAGANSAVPHHRPTDTVLAAGDLVKIDFGAVAGGYHSDMTRTLVLGEPADWQREIYEIVRTAQEAGCAALTAGADLAGIDAAARSIIDDAGYGENYVHGLGHGVGLEIHEAPGIGATATGTLPCGATVTVEPGIYLPGRGGVRIEDTLVVTDTGSRSLTRTSRTLRVL